MLAFTTQEFSFESIAVSFQSIIFEDDQFT